MAGRDSSSKRKSSKKKRDKTSSLKKIRKRESKKASRIHDSDSEHTSSSASESDCKIRTRKNKKLRRHHSKSSSSEDRSLSSDTSSDYKRKKKARRSRLNLKSKRKEGPDRSIRPQDNGKENSSGKKRKRSSRDYVEKAVKKSSKRKKTKKCSSSSSSETNSIESYEARKKRQLRSPSVSHVPSDGELLPVNNDDINYNSRRLRSVIAVVDHQQYDEAENRWDPHKEEIVYDPNDFPSPKSLNSNEEGIEMELDNQSFYESRYNEGALDNDGDRQLEVVDMSSNFEKEKVVDMLSSNFEKEKDSDTSVPVSALGVDVLESILRQKALENLKKFKGRLRTDGTSTRSKLNKESDIDKPSDVLVGKELIEQGTSNSQETNLNSGPAEKNDISEVKKLSGSENVVEESRLDTCPGGDIRDVGSNSIAELSPSSTRLEGENEAKDGSEFKEKTMSVMRGGEMVQVSYKVYIPKKSPALARKTLRR